MASTRPGARNLTGGVDHATFWFADWQASGDKLQPNADETLGPLLWTQYTSQDNTVKLMAFVVPLEEDANRTADFQVKRDSGQWQTLAVSDIDPLSRTALFRIDEWEDSPDQAYRVQFAWTGAGG